MRLQTLLATGTLLLALAPVGPAAGQVGCGASITEDTVLEDDLDCSGTDFDPVLTVEGPATLDLNGHVLTCPEGAVGIEVTEARARLVDGSVTGCTFAGILEGDGTHTVRDLTLTDGNAGLLLLSPGNRIQRNSIEEFGTGISVQAADNRLIGNHLDGNRQGIILDIDGPFTTVIANVVTGSELEGIVVLSGENAIRANDLSGNETGIAVGSDATANELTGNRAKGNDLDLLDQNLACDDNDWHGNTFDEADPEDCID